MANETTSPGKHASSVLAPTTNKFKRADKARKAPSPSPFLPHHQSYNRSAGTAATPLQNSGKFTDVRSFSAVFLAHAPRFNRDDLTAVPRLHISRRNQFGFHPGAGAVSALHISANPPLSNNRKNWAEGARTYGSHSPADGVTLKAPPPVISTPVPSTPALSSLALLSHCISVMTVLICEAGDPMGHRWLFKCGRHATEKSVKNSGNSGGIQTRNGDATESSENGRPTRALKPHPDRKIRKHQHEQHEQHERNMNPGKISVNSMNSMPTRMEIGGAAPRPPLQSERGHSGDPNAARPQFSTDKSVNNSANTANSAKPIHRDCHFV
jgi:hypothetical protein